MYAYIHASADFWTMRKLFWYTSTRNTYPEIPWNKGFECHRARVSFMSGTPPSTSGALTQTPCSGACRYAGVCLFPIEGMLGHTLYIHATICIVCRVPLLLPIRAFHVCISQRQWRCISRLFDSSSHLVKGFLSSLLSFTTHFYKLLVNCSLLICFICLNHFKTSLCFSLASTPHLTYSFRTLSTLVNPRILCRHFIFRMSLCPSSIVLLQV